MIIGKLLAFLSLSCVAADLEEGEEGRGQSLECVSVKPERTGPLEDRPFSFSLKDPGVNTDKIKAA